MTSEPMNAEQIIIVARLHCEEIERNDPHHRVEILEDSPVLAPGQAHWIIHVLHHRVDPSSGQWFAAIPDWYMTFDTRTGERVHLPHDINPHIHFLELEDARRLQGQVHVTWPDLDNPMEAARALKASQGCTSQDALKLLRGRALWFQGSRRAIEEIREALHDLGLHTHRHIMPRQEDVTTLDHSNLHLRSPQGLSRHLRDVLKHNE